MTILPSAILHACRRPYLLGGAYERAGPWLTAVGVAVLLGLLVAVGRWLKREGGRDEEHRSPAVAPPSSA